MAVSDQENWTRLKGTRRGSLRAISQHKAIAEGYEAAPSRRVVDLNQREHSATGCVEVPRFTYGKRK